MNNSLPSVDQATMDAVAKLRDPPGMNVFQLEEYWKEKVRVAKERNALSTALFAEAKNERENIQKQRKELDEKNQEQMQQFNLMTTIQDQRWDEQVKHQDEMAAALKRVDDIRIKDDELAGSFGAQKKEIEKKYSEENQAIEMEKLKKKVASAEVFLEKRKKELAELEAKYEEKKREDLKLLETLVEKTKERNDLEQKYHALLKEKREKSRSPPKVVHGRKNKQ